MLKKLAYGLVVTLLAGGLLAGCTANINVKPTEGGGINIVADTGAKGVSNNSNNKNSSSKSSSKKSTKTYTLKFGDHTSRCIRLQILRTSICKIKTIGPSV